MISSVRNFVVRILDADRFTIVLFQILDIKSNYLPGIVQLLSHNFSNDIINSTRLNEVYYLTCPSKSVPPAVNSVYSLQNCKP
jgi:hypothetical protein